ncbi:hypothetical protein OIO90_004609 [Microbotryomycetes sp. JL221]|nr:hypothetical protein OIO90_004609 [Microbotryomycetes sp. JL221]
MAGQTVGPNSASTTAADSTSHKESKQTATGTTSTTAEGDGPPRSGRACLACRKLKTRCEENTEPPCKRCRQQNLECLFVPSKRGKRPPRKNPDQTISEKFKNVEKSISIVLNSINAGTTPDPVALSQLQASLAEGLSVGDLKNSNNNNNNNSKTSTSSKDKINLNDDGTSPSSGSDSQSNVVTNQSSKPNKRARVDSISTGGGNNNTLQLSPSNNSSPFIGTTSLNGMSPTSSIAPSSGRLPQLSLNELTPRSKDNLQLSNRPASAHSSTTGGGGPLGMLADASLAAQIEGRTQLKGLEPDFNLSRVTEAIQDKVDTEGLEETRTPAILSKRIVTPEMAVEMFRLFFDWAYIHCPLLDPAQNTATSVCARSPFLFTAICAVASRFNSDPTLHVKCYDEAHACFVETIASGERTIEIVQACMIMTMWGSAPKGTEDRPQRAWMYFGMAVRMSLELGLFRPPAFVDAHLKANAGKPNPWVNMKHVPEEQQREALNRERTWLLVFVMDRYMSAVMGRPYQIHEAKPIMLPAHPMALPFDLGVIAHAEMQEIVGQVMDTFRDRIYGLPSASDEMPSPTVMKLFNSRMDEWRQRWCPIPGEPIANNLLFYFFSSKLFLNSIPLHTMLRNGDGSDDPASVSSTITAAKSIMEIAHEYAKLGVLLHCPDVNFLLLLYAAVFLVKVKVSNTRFSDLVDAQELQTLLLTNIQDCQAATCSERHAASTCHTLLRALLASWKAMTQAADAYLVAQQGQQGSLGTGGVGIQHGLFGVGTSGGSNGGSHHHRSTSQFGSDHFPKFVNGQQPSSQGNQTSSSSTTTSPQIGFHSPALGLQGTLARAPSQPASPAAYPFMHTPFASHQQHRTSMAPSLSNYFGTTGNNVTTGGGGGSGGGSGAQTPAGGGGGTTQGMSTSSNAMEPLDSFLSDTNFWNGIMVSQGADGFFSWDTGLGTLDSAGGLDNFNFDLSVPGTSAPGTTTSAVVTTTSPTDVSSSFESTAA